MSGTMDPMATDVDQRRVGSGIFMNASKEQNLSKPIDTVAGAEDVFRMVRDCFATDAASLHLGMTIASAEAGRVSMTMPITPEMLNGHGILHGGYIPHRRRVLCLRL